MDTVLVRTAARRLREALRGQGVPERALGVTRRESWLLQNAESIALPDAAWQAFLLPRSWEGSLPRGFHPRAAAVAREAATLLLSPQGVDRLLRSPPGYQAGTAPAAACILRVCQCLMEGGHGVTSVPTGTWVELADHFGMWRLRYLLEDAALRRSDPANYDIIATLVLHQERAYGGLLKEITDTLREALRKEGLASIRVEYRRKNVAGIANKMWRKGKSIGHITDVFAFRLIAERDADCYAARDVLRTLWDAAPEQASDFIANPKPNGYQSLHETVRCLRDTQVEFQIRTRKMDWIARHGPAAHRLYKAAHRRH